MTVSLKLSSKKVFSKIAQLVLLASFFATLGCNKQGDTTKSVDQDGYCTYTYIRDFNEVIASSAEYQEILITDSDAKKYERFSNLKNSCGIFKEAHINVECVAQKISDQKEAKVSSTHLITNNCSQSLSYKPKDSLSKLYVEKPFTGIEYKDLIERSYKAKTD